MYKKNIILKKFIKQISLKEIGVHGQKKITSAKVLVIGLGGLGCPLLIYLANSGITNLGIVDNDIIEISNLNRQIIFNYTEIGKRKTEITRKFLKKINNQIRLRVFNSKINKKNISKIIRNYDIICDGTDNFESRLLINDHCKLNGKILISAAINKFQGHLFKFDFRKKTPCFRCYMPEIPKYLRNCDSDGIMSTIAGIIGTFQANEVLRTILNLKSDISGHMIIFDGLKLNFRKSKISINKRCQNNCYQK